jgi:hypothetical protein
LIFRLATSPAASNYGKGRISILLLAGFYLPGPGSRMYAAGL